MKSMHGTKLEFATVDDPNKYVAES
jgi:hypothetical protein